MNDEMRTGERAFVEPVGIFTWLYLWNPRERGLGSITIPESYIFVPLVMHALSTSIISVTDPFSV
jgi:hypothetical protein